MTVARTGSQADATMAAMMDGALAQRLRDEELAREIGKALARSRPTLDDLPTFVRRGRRVDVPVDARVDEPWGAFERKRATSEDQRAALFDAAAIPPRSPTRPPLPHAHRRPLGWPWLLAATVAGGVAVQSAAPQWWPAVGQRAMQGVDDLRAALKARQSHGEPTLPVAFSAIATPPPDIDAQAPEFVPLPIPVVTTSPRFVPRSNTPPPPPAVTSSRRSSSAAKGRAQAEPVTRITAATAVEAAIEAPAESARDTPNDATAMADPTPTPTPLQDPPHESPPIQEPPPESPPDEVPKIREPPPAEVPTPIPNEGPNAP